MTREFVGKAITVSELINYQKGSVVSKEVLRKKAGNITLFAFDKEEGLTEHTSPFDAVVCILDGKAEVMIGGISHHVKSGEMIIMPAGKPHALKAVERFKMMLIMLRSD